MKPQIIIHFIARIVCKYSDNHTFSDDTLNKMKRFFLFVFRWIRRIILAFIISTVLMVVLYRFVNPPLTPLMLIRYTENLFSKDEARIIKSWKSLENISPSMVQAVIASEDNNFLKHYGFDVDAIKKAQEHNKKSKRKRGASTISQQTAKNVFLWPQRSWLRKGLEAYFTFMIELVWSKERIMEVYLNIIETGQGIYGAEAAAQNYFNKPAKKLSRGECALIAATLPAPLKRNPAKPTAYMLSRQQWILWNMNNIGKINFNTE